MLDLRLIKKIFIGSALALSIVGINACGEKKEAQKSLEQIRSAEGIPVRVEAVQTKEFTKVLTFFTRLRGYEESTKGAMVGDRILKIKAKVGSSVSAGSILVEFPSNNPALQITQAKTALENTKRTLDRMTELLKSGEISQQNVDNVRTQYEVDKRNYEALKQMIYIEAPISGVITEMKYKEGDFVNAGDPLFTVAKLNKMIAKVWASEKEVMSIRQGMDAEVNVSGKIFKGKVSLVPLAMDNDKRAFGVEVLLDNPKRELKSGVTVETKLKTYTNSNTIAVQRNLVMWDGQNKYVFVENGGVAQKRIVSVGEESGMEIEIKSGLNAGDKLIVEGQSLVNDGSKLKLIQQ